MGKFRFWATIILAIVLGILGLWLGGVASLPAPITTIQSRILYFLIGTLAGLLTYAKIASWAVQTTARLTRQLATNLALEVVRQAGNIGIGKKSPPSSLFEHVDGTASTPQATLKLFRKLCGAIIIDTSSIIDGRLLDVAKAGFLSGLILIPNFVLVELQQVADSADRLKRMRGRNGFTVLEQLKKLPYLEIKIWEKEVLGKTVDEKLINLVKAVKGKLLTCDYNLGKIAQVSGLTILNLNALGNALRTIALPGEKLSIKIAHIGKDKDQGVGYLVDGTMVVVKGASTKVNKEVNLEVNKVIQGPAGRMIFGKVIHIT